MVRYGEALKDQAVARLLPPENGSVDETVREVVVGVSTLERWQQRPHIEVALTTADMDKVVLSAVS
jgi:transposase